MSITQNKNQILKFYDSIAPVYDCLIKGRWDRTFKDRKKNLLKDSLKRYETILDCGCGTGIDTIYLGKQGHKIIGCDISKKILEKARENSKKFGVDNVCQFIECDMLELERTFGADRFDAAISIGNVLFHLDSYESILIGLKNLYSVIRPGGKCILQFDDSYDNFRNEIKKKGVFFHIENDCLNYNEILAIHIWPFMAKRVFSKVILIENKQNVKYRLFQLPMTLPYRGELQRLLKKAGFIRVSVDPNNKRGVSSLNSIWIGLKSKKAICRSMKGFYLIAYKPRS